MSFNGTNVKLLQGSDFDNAKPWKLRNGRCAVVLFFAEWCGHCQHLKPDYIKFADLAQFIPVCAVDSDQNKALLDKLKGGPVAIQGFPTIWLYKCGEPAKEYNGPRTVQALLAAATGICNGNCSCDGGK